MPEVHLRSGRQFVAEPGESLLSASLKAELLLEHSCRSGRCNACKALCLSGQTAVIQDELGLSDDERGKGWILTCARTALSDVVLDVAEIDNVMLAPARTLPCRIQGLDLAAPDVLRVVLRFPPTAELQYMPGQYVDVLGPEGVRRSYSVANAPRHDRTIELHIRQVNGGAMSRYWFEQAKVQDLLRINGPRGTFFLRNVDGKDLLFLATGTGIAPVKAMLEGLATLAPDCRPRSMAIYWGGRRPEDIYLGPEPQPLPAPVVPVLSRAEAGWRGERGYVQDVALRDRPDLSNAAVYACGSSAMILSAEQQLTAAGLPPGQFHSDAFVCSASPTTLGGAIQ